MSIRERIKEILISPKEGRPADDLLREFVVIPRAELPSTTADTSIHSMEVDGVSHSVWPLTMAAADQAYRDALEYLAAAEGIKRWTSKQEVLKRDKAQRRDELAAEFTAVNSYGGLLPYTQKLIDRIIELERKTK